MTSNNSNKRQVIIAPSILSADFAHLADEIARVEEAGADLIHLDIMDGHFVPNISFGPGIVKTVRKLTRLPLDVHLMISDPGLYIPRFADSGADYLTIHFEATQHLHRHISSIKNLGLKAGISLNPHNPPFLVDEILGDIDLLLLMSVNPGFGGQTFIETTIDKIKAARNVIDECNYNCLIEVDGGINDITGSMCVEAGADILVAGNYIFNADNYAEVIKSLKR